MSMRRMKVEVSLPGLANPKYQDLSFSELNRRGCRVCGGDKGDVHFKGYVLDEENNRTILHNPELHCFSVDELTQDEANAIAQEVIDFSFEAIGFEAIEHS